MTGRHSESTRRACDMDEREMTKLIDVGWLAAIAGILGRVMAQQGSGRPFFRKSQLWEIPAGVGLGWVGVSFGDYAGLPFALSVTLGLLLSREGPEAADRILAALYKRLKM